MKRDQSYFSCVNNFLHTEFPFKIWRIWEYSWNLKFRYIDNYISESCIILTYCQIKFIRSSKSIWMDTCVGNITTSTYNSQSQSWQLLILIKGSWRLDFPRSRREKLRQSKNVDLSAGPRLVNRFGYHR